MSRAYNTLSDILTDSYSPAIAIPELNARIYYSELRKWITKLGNQEPFLGCKKGEVVCIVLGNGIEFVIAFFWAMLHGIVVCSVDNEFEISEQVCRIRKVKPKLVIVHADSKLHETIQDCCLVSIVAELHFQTRTTSLVRLILPTKPKKAARAATITVKTLILNDTVTKVRESSNFQRFPETSDVAVILSTAGATRESKLVPLTHSAILGSIESFAETLHIDVFARTYLAMPLHHAHGLIGILLPTMLTGGTVVMPLKPLARDIVKSLIRWRVTWFSAYPSYYQTILEKSNQIQLNESKLKFIQCCGSHLSQSKLFALEKFFGVPVISSYTMTEACWIVATNSPFGIRSPGSVGVACGLELLIFNEHDNNLASGFGEICISGPSVFNGYLDSKSARFFNHNNQNWFRTGDVGYFNEINSLVVTGRLTEVIEYNGQKLYPHLLEQVQHFNKILSKLSSVESAVFFGSKKQNSENYSLEAAVVFRPNLRASDGEMREWMRSWLSIDIPMKFHIVPNVPRTFMGKVQRHKVIASTQLVPKL